MSRKNYLTFILIFPVLLIALFFILHIGRLFSGGPFSGGFFGRNENRKFEDYAEDLFRQEVSKFVRNLPVHWLQHHGAING